MGTVLIYLGSLLFPLLQPTPPASESTNVSATITLRDVDLGELIEKMKLKVGYAIGGKVTVQANISVPLSSDAASASKYTIRGKLTSAELKLEGLRAKDVTAEVLYDKGKLTLTALKATLPPDAAGDASGELSGTASAAIEPRGDLVASLTLTRLPLGELLKAVPGGVSIGGAVSGKADFKAPVEKLNDPSNWVGSGDLSAAALTVFGRAVKDAKLKLAVKDGKATLTDVSGVIEGIPTSGDGTLTLSGKYPFTATVRTRPQEVSELQKLVPELALPVAIRGKLETTSTADGALSPFAISANGTVTANDFGVGDTPADKFSAKWKVTPERVTITNLAAGVFQGMITGSADIPLQSDKQGQFQVKFTDVDSAGVASAFPKVPVKLTGRVSGDVTGKLPSTKPNETRPVSADVNLSAPKLTVQGIPAEKLAGKLSLEGSAVKYELEGKTLGGSFEVKGRYPEAKQPAPSDKDEGVVNVRGIDLSRLAEALRIPGFQLRGIVDLTFRYAADLSNGDGRYSIRGFGLGREQLIPEISGRLRLRDGNLQLTDLVGPVTGGTVRARVRANLDEPTRNFYRLDIDRADVGRLLGTFANRPHLIEGGVSLTARGKLWPEFTANGSIGLSRGRIAGLTTSDVRIPFQLSVRGGGGQLTVRDVAGSLGDGRVTGQFEYHWGASGRTTGQLRFTNVRIGNLLTDLKQSNYFGSARVTGRIDLGGENVRSGDDLTAQVVASIEQAAVRDLPVLDAITPFVSPTALLKPFGSGELRGRLSRGVFRIEKLTLASSNTDLFADGTITTAGRLDLGVIVRTGTLGLNDNLLRQLGLNLPLPIGPFPVQVIRDVSAFLSNRTVRLTITGTASRPQPQVNTAALFTDEAIRFFLRRYLPTAAAVLPEVSPRTTR